jgi:hypothetical protein
MRRIDGVNIIRAEELIGNFTLHYNQAISESEATGEHIRLRRSAYLKPLNDVDAEFETLAAGIR